MFSSYSEAEWFSPVHSLHAYIDVFMVEPTNHVHLPLYLSKKCFNSTDTDTVCGCGFILLANLRLNSIFSSWWDCMSFAYTQISCCIFHGFSFIALVQFATNSTVPRFRLHGAVAKSSFISSSPLTKILSCLAKAALPRSSLRWTASGNIWRPNFVACSYVRKFLMETNEKVHKSPYQYTNSGIRSNRFACLA